MNETEKARPSNVRHMGLISALWLLGLLGWTLVLLFAIPYLQKAILIPGSDDFLHYETGYGVFTISGYFAFMLLLLLALILRLSPPEGGTKGVGVLMLILLSLSLSGLAETFVGYKYISTDTLATRSIFSPIEKAYDWTDVRNVDVSFTLHSTGSNNSVNVSFLKWRIVLDDSAGIVVENAVKSDFSGMKRIYSLIPDTVVFRCGEPNREYWDFLRTTVFEKR